jgi:hypothetical protein
VAQAVAYLPSVSQVLNSIPSTVKKPKTRKEEEKRINSVANSLRAYTK